MPDEVFEPVCYMCFFEKEQMKSDTSGLRPYGDLCEFHHNKLSRGGEMTRAEYRTAFTRYFSGSRK